jgi:hypothetical protein
LITNQERETLMPTKKPAKPKPPRRNPAPPSRHTDSVVREDDDEDAIDVSGEADDEEDDEEDEGGGRNSLSRIETEDRNPGAMVPASPEVGKAARDLILQAKEAMSRKGGHFPAHVTLELENDTEIDAAMMLEHQGRGRLFKEGGEWCFEFNEEGMMGGVLRGDVLQSKD